MMFLPHFAILQACAPPPASQGGFYSLNPASRIYAAQNAGNNRDTTAIPQLVEQLESEDPALRIFAINALERITNTRLGYNPYDSRPNRVPAIKRWVEAVNKNQFKHTAQP